MAGGDPVLWHLQPPPRCKAPGPCRFRQVLLRQHLARSWGGTVIPEGSQASRGGQEHSGLQATRQHRAQAPGRLRWDEGGSMGPDGGGCQAGSLGQGRQAVSPRLGRAQGPAVTAPSDLKVGQGHPLGVQGGAEPRGTATEEAELSQACLRVQGMPVGFTVGQFICERGHNRHHRTDIYCLCPGGWKSARILAQTSFWIFL